MQIAVAHNITSELASLANLRRLLGVIGLTTFALLALVIQVFIRSALRPIRLVQRELASRNVAGLASDITEGESLPSELIPLVDSFNSVLGRIREGIGQGTPIHIERCPRAPNPARRTLCHPGAGSAPKAFAGRIRGGYQAVASAGG